MYNYQPLRDLLNTRNQTVKWLMREVGFTSNVAVALNNDRAVTLDNIAAICRYLNVPIEQIIQITLD